ncbi:reprolysin-like metallopeptidase [Gaetbulibacter sp. M240]|uniref:zinc-dependent metalloprotease n=1 Tax=Gaetbulibacter sp. M240 TaxID=3126511 RepID=UPI00374EFFE9
MKTNLHFVLSITIFLISFSALSQNGYWKLQGLDEVPQKLVDLHINPQKAAVYNLTDPNILWKLQENILPDDTTIYLPDASGTIHPFQLVERSVFSPSLAAKYPYIKSYVGFATDGSKARVRLSVSPQGLHGMMSAPDKSTVFMQPVAKGSPEYMVYNKNMKLDNSGLFNCATIENLQDNVSKTSIAKLDEGGANTQTLQKFRIVISTTSEYTAYHDDGDNGNGNAISDALAAINVTLSRINELFETDMAVTFELVDAPGLIFNNAANDPYSDADIGASSSNTNSQNGWSLQLQNTLSTTNVLGANLNERNNAYDIGHLFGASGGGGNAGCLGCVCNNDTVAPTDHNKGSGFSSPANGIPEGDTFDLNYVAHEIGHQMGARHTFAFEDEPTNNVQSEPGSGSTIMAYAGITGENDVQPDSDDYFHYHSIKQILTNLSTKSCQTTQIISNNPPLSNAGIDYIIPAGTPYLLKGLATDADINDNLTYCWEQIDNGITNYLNFGPTLTTEPMNRSLPPSSSPYRYIPRLSSVLNGQVTQTNPGLGSDWETAATVDRVLNWALTVRDRSPSNPISGQSSFDTMQIQVIDGTPSNPVGPFMVTSQSSTNISWTQNTTETITWDVANTNDQAGVNTQNVNIFLSTDGGLTFNTVLKSNTPNDGSEQITVPNLAAPFCRIMVKPVNNIFYAVNSTDFAIGYNVTTTCNQQYSSASNLNLAIRDGNTTTSFITVPDNGMISSLKVNVDVTHTYISDLKVVLKSPNNTSVTLWDENCFGTGDNDFDIIFEDGAPAVFCATPTTGTYTPVEPLSVFEGMDISGTWQLTVMDNYAGDVGTLNNWYLDFCIATVTLGMDDTPAFADLSVYPNPNSGDFTVSLNGAESEFIQIEAFDVSGRSIYNQRFSDRSQFNEQIHLDAVASGMYLIKISDDNKRSVIKKILVN